MKVDQMRCSIANDVARDANKVAALEGVYSAVRRSTLPTARAGRMPILWKREAKRCVKRAFK